MDYELDPSLLDVALNPEEVKVLLAANGNPLRAEAAARHFMQRVLVSLDDAQRRISQAARDLTALTAGSAHAGKPTTLSPVDAVKFLSAAQRAQAFNDTQRQMLEHARQVKADAEAYRERIVAFMDAAQRAQASLANIPGLDPAVKTHLDNMFNNLLGGGA